MKNRSPLKIKYLAGIFALALSLAFVCADHAFSETPARRPGYVTRVVDGDTFVLENGERVRLIGINTPENQPWRNKVDYYGKEASKYLKDLLTRQRVFLERDIVPKDRYNRTLAYVYLEKGDFVNEKLVEEGYAFAKYYHPNGRYRAKLEEAERRARAAKKGLWRRSK